MSENLGVCRRLRVSFVWTQRCRNMSITSFLSVLLQGELSLAVWLVKCNL